MCQELRRGALARAPGVICNAGFSLISEAPHLGKRVLAKAVRRQTEQESNAESLEQLGLATVCRRLEAGAIAAWLQSVPSEPRNYPKVLDAVVEWIEERRWDTLPDLSAALWSSVGGGH